MITVDPLADKLNAKIEEIEKMLREKGWRIRAEVVIDSAGRQLAYGKFNGEWHLLLLTSTERPLVHASVEARIAAMKHLPTLYGEIRNRQEIAGGKIVTAIDEAAAFLCFLKKE